MGCCGDADNFDPTTSGEIVVLTFKPGSTDTGPFVFNDWEALYEALDTLRTAQGGHFWIVIDDTRAPVFIPAGAYDLNRCELLGVRDIATQVSVTFLDGCAITNLSKITGLALFKQSAGTPPIQLSTAAFALHLIGCAVAGGANPGMQVIQASADPSAIYLDEITRLTGTPNAGAILVDAGITLQLYVESGGVTIDAQAVEGDATTTLTLYVHAAAAQFASQVLLAGTLAVQQQIAVWYWGSGNPNGIVTAMALGMRLIDSSTAPPITYVCTALPSTWSVEHKQVFRYVATGAEPNPFPVALPAARPDANYNVQCTMGGPAANAIKDARPLVASFTVNAFNVEMGAAVEAGDVFMFTVEQLT